MAKTATAEKEAKKTTKKKATVKKAAKTGKKYLVIVESPAKAATIGKFLGNNYKIEMHPWDMCVTCRKARWVLILSMTLNRNILPSVGRGSF